MAEEITLELAPREMMGKKVRFLRRDGITPVHVYGSKEAPESLQCERTILERLLARAGSNTPVFLSVPGKSDRQLAMVREVQVEPVRGALLHVDFLRVEAAVAITVEVPLVFEGESPGARAAGGNVVQVLYNLGVEALPLDIPHQLTVDLTRLTEPAMTIRAQDVTLPPSVTLTTQPEALVARIEVPQEVEEVGEGAAQAAEASAGTN